ncbi:hypothetical protein WICPIJ_004620 [Wickerhamomyces pijperi]|uniref:Uncharacterized protein n=1 Tax=Wickerhamomyces pijperi TaxID=599730 RepID=A0A9P8Q7T6_WICPI|nr:hypothetical protein WICPIJ_004620 [Wickerhamomyces pijperi]
MELAAPPLKVMVKSPFVDSPSQEGSSHLNGLFQFKVRSRTTNTKGEDKVQTTSVLCGDIISNGTLQFGEVHDISTINGVTS